MAKKSEEKEVKGIKLPGGITESMLANFKTKHGAGNVKCIEVPLDDRGENKVACYVCKPTMVDLSAAAAVQERDPLLAGQILYDNCYLAGDPETVHNEEVKMSVIVALKSIFKVRLATIKEV